MPRKLLAIALSSAVLWTSVAAAAQPAAEPVKPAPAATSPNTTATGNKSPLPPGPARIKTAQGLEENDLGPGVIIAAWAVAIGAAFAVAFSGGDDDDNGPPTTGTN